MGNKTLKELQAEFTKVWANGAAARQQSGELLSQIKGKMKHGDWGKWLKANQIPRSTADDYIKEYNKAAGIFPSPVNNPRPKHHPTQIRPTLKDLNPKDVVAYWAAVERDETRVQNFWLQTFHAIIGSVALPEDQPELVEVKA